jgi:hypothetical protein
MNTILKFLEWRWYGCGAGARMNDATISAIDSLLPFDIRKLDVLIAALEWNDFAANEKKKRGYARWTPKQK